MVAQYVHYSEAYIRVEGLTVEVDVVHRHALASILTWRHLVGDLLCESHRNLTLPIALSAHHEPLAAIEFVKGGAHRGDPALIAQVEFHAYGVTEGASMAGILLVSWATTVSCRRRSSVRASRSASSCSRRYRIWSCSEAMSSDWSPGTPMLGVWFAPDVPSPNRTNTVPLSFVVGRVPRLIRLRTASSVMPNAAAAWAKVRRSWFACMALSHEGYARPLGPGTEAL